MIKISNFDETSFIHQQLEPFVRIVLPQHIYEFELNAILPQHALFVHHLQQLVHSENLLINQ
jgi:hypothetical protein